MGLLLPGAGCHLQHQRMQRVHAQMLLKQPETGQRRRLDQRWKVGRVVRTRTQAPQQRSTSRPSQPALGDGGDMQQVSNVLINEALLIAVLALTAYAVLTVDSDAWRGWYPNEILYRVPLDNW